MTDGERWIPKDPQVRAGLYHSIEDVPDRLLLANFEARFGGRDCWREYLDATGLADGCPKRRQNYLDRCGERWKELVQDRSPHHALCTPADADAYAVHLLEERELSDSVATEYWGEIERFYRWMFRNPQYPHRYHPFRMAAIDRTASNRLWIQLVSPN